jgi:hypothetical protein
MLIYKYPNIREDNIYIKVGNFRTRDMTVFLVSTNNGQIRLKDIRRHLNNFLCFKHARLRRASIIIKGL